MELENSGVMFVCQHDPDDPPGTNIVGVLPGSRWGTPQDRLVLVGAHWDTVLNTGGLDDNGSGVSAMLELGRTNLSDKTSHIFQILILIIKVSRPQVFHSGRALNHGKCALEFSVLMVAFDLEEVASQGSLAFIQDFLIPTVLKQTGAEIQGEPVRL